jgi:hypothetical protein
MAIVIMSKPYDFLQELVGDLPEGAMPVVCGFKGDPKTVGGWNPVMVNGHWPKNLTPDMNLYIGVSSVSSLSDKGGYSASGFEALHFVMVDDIAQEELPLVPSWVVETSLNNYQNIYVLDEPLLDVVKARRLCNLLADIAGGDTNAKGPARWTRLPFGINGKPKYEVEGKAPKVKLSDGDSWIKYSVEEITEAFGIDLDQINAPTSNSESAQLSREKIDEMLGHVDPDMDYDSWKDVLMAVQAAGGTFEQAEAWSRKGSSYEESALTTSKWDSFSGDGGITARTLAMYASEGGWDGDIVEADLDAFEEGEESEEQKRPNIPVVVSEVNEKFALVSLQGRIRVMHEKLSVDGVPTQEFMTSADFGLLMCNEKSVIVGEKPVPLATYWMGSPQRRGYEGITFIPKGINAVGGDADNKNYFNTWAGFMTTPKKGDCSKYLAHLKDVICAGDQEHYEFVVSWMAELVQRPERKIGCALVMKGGKGSGKGTIVKPLAEALGRHYMYVSSMQALLGNFNSHLGEAVLVFADEALWGGDKKADGALKSLITEPKIVLEKKGIDKVLINSHHHIIMATNEDWVVPASKDERRYMVVECSDESKPREYFDALHEELENGGAEALMGVLANWEAPDWVDFYRPPVTEALLDQQTHTQSVQETWWEEVIDTRVIKEAGEHGFEYEEGDWVELGVIVDSMIHHGRKRGISVAALTRKTVGKFLTRKREKREIMKRRRTLEGKKVTEYKLGKH